MIDDAFEVEGFQRGPEVVTGGQRRSLFDMYANAIDWTNMEQVGRAIRVFEEILSWGGDSEYTVKALEKVRRYLEYDGYSVDDQRRIRSTAGQPVTNLPLEELRDPSAIEEHLQRLNATGDSDPPLAISSAKALAEATSKHVLEELGYQYGERADLPELARDVQRALKLHPDDIAPTTKGRETVVRTLSNLSQLITGLAELRNEYGADHGRTRSASGLGARHAHLAVGAAQTFCRFLLETLTERRRVEE